ncbi:MAG TPA: carboxymuconolactone decarboxylase family protein [Burkholderiales bacterium]|nr:carboxymuconolactone decarboxylase family protein [Burkholderiales bacterium]
MNEELYQQGMAQRRKVLGDKHVSKRQGSDDRFTKQHNELVTQAAWGLFWSREDKLPLKTRSLVTIAMLTAINRSDELKGHINGALNNGATPDEIAEVFLHASVYLGWPASGTSLRVAVEVFKERGLI